MISLASGPFGSVKMLPGVPPDHAWPIPSTLLIVLVGCSKVAVKSPVVGVGADGPRREVGRLQVETLGRSKCAKLFNAGGACCGLAEVLDSTLYQRCA